MRLIPGENWSFLAQKSLIAYSCLTRGGALEISLSMLACRLVLPGHYAGLVQTALLLNSHGYSASVLSRRHSLAPDILAPESSSTLSTPSSLTFSEPQVKSCVVCYPNACLTFNCYFFLYFQQLQQPLFLLKERSFFVEGET